ncbi:MAG: hypothetical protein ABL925_19960 [Methylococcales bacterium]
MSHTDKAKKPKFTLEFKQDAAAIAVRTRRGFLEAVANREHITHFNRAWGLAL